MAGNSPVIFPVSTGLESFTDTYRVPHLVIENHPLGEHLLSPAIGESMFWLSEGDDIPDAPGDWDLNILGDSDECDMATNPIYIEQQRAEPTDPGIRPEYAVPVPSSMGESQPPATQPTATTEREIPSFNSITSGPSLADSLNPRECSTGQQRFTCTYAGCGGIAFSKHCDWRKHMDKHERPHRCTLDDCALAFTNKGDLERHQWTIHQTCTRGQRKYFFCPEPACPRFTESFSRKDNRDQHWKRCHGKPASTASPPSMRPRAASRLSGGDDGTVPDSSFGSMSPQPSVAGSEGGRRRRRRRKRRRLCPSPASRREFTDGGMPEGGGDVVALRKRVGLLEDQIRKMKQREKRYLSMLTELSEEGS